MISGMLNQECQIINRTQDGAEDDYGAPTWEEESPVDTFFHHQPIDSEELNSRTGGRATERSWYSIDTDIRIHARVIAASGQGWEVEGEPRRWVAPLGTLSFIEADLVEVIDEEEEDES